MKEVAVPHRVYSRHFPVELEMKEVAVPHRVYSRHFPVELEMKEVTNCITSGLYFMTPRFCSWCYGSSDRSFTDGPIELFLFKASAP